MENNNQPLNEPKKPLTPPPAPPRPPAPLFAKPPAPAASAPQPPKPPSPQPAAQKKEEPSPEEIARKSREMKIALGALCGICVIGVGFAAYIITHPRSAPAVSNFKPVSPVDSPQPAQQEPDITAMLLSSVTAIAPQMASAPFLAQGEKGDAARKDLGDASNDILAVFAKYKDRPVAKKFWSDLMAQPEFQNVKKSGLGPDPVATLNNMKSSPAFMTLMVKYSKNPEFVQVVKEITSDPGFVGAVTKANSANGFNQGGLSGVIPPKVQEPAAEPQMPDGTMQVNMDAMSSSQNAAQSRPVAPPPQLGSN
jgi:hypothetical protein